MPEWAVLLPVKRLDRAKSRLRLAAAERAALVLAMAADTATAAGGSPRVAEVVAITSDTHAATTLRGCGARVIGDDGFPGLNRALHHAGELVRRRRPGACLVVVTADLPGLRGQHLTTVLDALEATDPQPAAGRPVPLLGVVGDAAGSGSTLLAAAGGAELVPRFGRASFERHRRLGAVDLTAHAQDGLRRDVDTLRDLQRVLHLGVGPRTAELSARLADTIGPGSSHRTGIL